MQAGRPGAGSNGCISHEARVQNSERRGLGRAKESGYWGGEGYLFPESCSWMHFLSDPLLREILRLLRWTSWATGTDPVPGPLPRHAWVLCNQVLLARDRNRTEKGEHKKTMGADICQDHVQNRTGKEGAFTAQMPVYGPCIPPCPSLSLNYTSFCTLLVGWSCALPATAQGG